jgi:hypothetical protein
MKIQEECSFKRTFCCVIRNAFSFHTIQAYHGRNSFLDFILFFHAANITNTNMVEAQIMLTSCTGTVLVEKLIVAQLVNKLPALTDPQRIRNYRVKTYNKTGLPPDFFPYTDYKARQSPTISNQTVQTELLF